jgi:hypothetical protein
MKINQTEVCAVTVVSTNEQFCQIESGAAWLCWDDQYGLIDYSTNSKSTLCLSAPMLHQAIQQYRFVMRPDPYCPYEIMTNTSNYTLRMAEQDWDRIAQTSAEALRICRGQAKDNEMIAATVGAFTAPDKSNLCAILPGTMLTYWDCDENRAADIMDCLHGTVCLSAQTMLQEVKKYTHVLRPIGHDGALKVISVENYTIGMVDADWQAIAEPSAIAARIYNAQSCSAR